MTNERLEVYRNITKTTLVVTEFLEHVAAIEAELAAAKAECKTLREGMRTLSSVCSRRWDMILWLAGFAPRGLVFEKEWQQVQNELDSGSEGTVAQSEGDI